MSNSPPFKTYEYQQGIPGRRLCHALTEVGKRVLEFIHEFYEVGIHDLWDRTDIAQMVEGVEERWLWVERHGWPSACSR